jgi:serine/threonine protein kinase
MDPKLTLVGGPDNDSRSFTFKVGQPFIIGRGRDSHTRIQDPRVSRIHCRVEWEGDQAFVRDEGSPAGTYVNGQRVSRTRLRSGSVIQIGDTLLRFEVGTFDQPTIAPKRVERPVATPPPLTELVGKTLASFKVERIITPTRSGMVYQGHDVKTGEPAAIKVLAPDLIRLDEQKRRFVRAMKTMLPLRHDHLIRILNAGKSGPFCWVAMEYIDGESLKQVIQRVGVNNMLDWRESWRIAIHVARALQYAFEKNVVHRNLTPTNILRRKSDKRYLLGDLMLAKALDGLLSDQVTEPGRFVGELAYMAPERTYSGSEVDHRADLYSLGATLYWLVTGQPPFTGESFGELLRQVRDRIPQPPREFSISIQSDFSDLILRLLAKRPDERPGTPAILILELERIGRYDNLKEPKV